MHYDVRPELGKHQSNDRVTETRPVPPPILSGRCGLGEGALRGISGKDRVAPIPDLPVLAAEREGSTPSRPSYPVSRWSCRPRTVIRVRSFGVLADRLTSVRLAAPLPP